MFLSIVVTISRPENIPLVVENLRSLNCNPYAVELVVGIDNNGINAMELEKLFAPLQEWKNITVFNTKLRPSRKFDMHTRRKRIASLRNMTKEDISASDFVFSFEDDTVLPTNMNVLMRFVEVWKDLDNPGMIEGVQVGRWGQPYVGAWQVDDISNPSQYMSMSRGLYEIDMIHAGGFYCYLTTTKLYKEIAYAATEPMGPDVDFGLQLSRMGYTNYIDWSVVCGHRIKDQTLYPTEVVVIKRQFERGRWRDKVIKV